MREELEYMINDYRRKRTQDKISENSYNWLVSQARQVEKYKLRVYRLENVLEEYKNGEQSEGEPKETINTTDLWKQNNIAVGRLDARSNELETNIHNLEKEIEFMYDENKKLEDVNTSLLAEKYKEAPSSDDEQRFRKALEKIVLMPSHTQMSEVKDLAIKTLNNKED